MSLTKIALKAEIVSLKKANQRLEAEIKRLREWAKQSFVDPAFAKALVEWAGEETNKKQAGEIERLQGIVDNNAKTADLLDRTLTALEKQLEIPLKAAEAKRQEFPV